MESGWYALRRGESARERRMLLERAHERFLEDPGLLDDPAADRAARERFPRLRPAVLDSWVRARSRRVDPDRAPARLALGAEELRELRERHPLSRVLPVVRRLLLEEATDAGFIVAIGDAAGRLLWIDGDSRLRGRAEGMGFAAGVDWSEEAVGTSAPGSAIALDHGIQVLGAEHYNRAVHPWSCSAVPVHDPESGGLLGVIDVTGDDRAASPHLLPLLGATRAAVEAELRVARLRALVEREGTPRARRSPDRPEGACAAAGRRPRLLVLGREPALLEGASGPVPVGGRHAEILLALALAPEGLAAAALAERVYGDGRSAPTLRPEMVRLRRWLEGSGACIALESRPYRLDRPVEVDAAELLGALARGSHRLALAAYRGAVLPASDAPVAERLREETDATLREAMLQSAGADALFAYAQRWAPEDAEVWETLLRILPPLSPRRARVVARLESLAG